MIKLQNNPFLKIINNPSELEGCSSSVIEKIILEQNERPLFFSFENQNFDVIKKEYNLNKRIFKSGFLFHVYKILFPTYKNQELYKIISEKYHIFIKERQFYRDVQQYNSNIDKFYK